MRYELSEMEKKLSDLIWDNEPLASGMLVKLCEAEFQWKKSTSYTMLKKLETKGVFINEGGNITSLLSKDDFMSIMTKDILDEMYDGSLSNFILFYTRNQKLSDAQLDTLQRFIDSQREVKGWNRSYIRL